MQHLRHDPVQLLLCALDAGDGATARALAVAIGADPWLSYRADGALRRRGRRTPVESPGARALLAVLAERLLT